MKKVILSLAIVASTFALGQKKQIKKAFYALEENDLKEASKQIKEADKLLAGKTYLLEPSLLEKFYLLKGLDLLGSGKVEEGAKVLDKLNDLGKQKIYRGKDADKNKVYFVGKAAADASGISGLKEKSFTPNPEFKKMISTLVNPSLQAVSKAAIDNYNNKKFALAGKGFEQTYQLLKATGNDDKQYLYNAGLSYIYAKQNNTAIKIFKDLIHTGYTGVKTTYTAKDKNTGQTVTVDRATWLLLKNNDQYSDFKTNISKSVEEDLYNTTAALLIEEKKYDEANAIVEKGLKKFHGSSKLLSQQGVIYAKLGKNDEFINNLKEQVKTNPNDALAWYNLGVLYAKSNQKDEAEMAYKRSITIKPGKENKNAYLSLAYLMMGDDEKFVKEYNKLINKKGGRAKAEKMLKARRERFKKALPYAEKMYELDKQDINAVGLLKSIYRAIKNKAKYKEFKQLEEQMSK